MSSESFFLNEAGTKHPDLYDCSCCSYRVPVVAFFVKCQVDAVRYESNVFWSFLYIVAHVVSTQNHKPL